MLTGIDQHTNFSKGILLQGYTSTDTIVSFIPGNGAKFPLASNGEYNLVWWNNTDYADPADDPQVEIVRVVSTVGDVFTILRAQEGTSATNKNVPNKTYKMVLSFTQHVLDEIIAAAGVGSVTGGSSEGAGIAVFDAANSTASTLFFKSLTAGANVTLTDNGTSVSIASVGGSGGGYNLIQNSGTSVTQETTINLTSLLNASDVGGKTQLDINVANLAADSAFVTDIAASLIADSTFLYDLANSSTFVTDLVANTSFIDDLTSNSTFQTNVNNFVSGGGIGSTKEYVFGYAPVSIVSGQDYNNVGALFFGDYLIYTLFPNRSAGGASGSYSGHTTVYGADPNTGAMVPVANTVDFGQSVSISSDGLSLYTLTATIGSSGGRTDNVLALTLKQYDTSLALVQTSTGTFTFSAANDYFTTGGLSTFFVQGSHLVIGGIGYSLTGLGGNYFNPDVTISGTSLTTLIQTNRNTQYAYETVNGGDVWSQSGGTILTSAYSSGTFTSVGSHAQAIPDASPCGTVVGFQPVSPTVVGTWRNTSVIDTVGASVAFNQYSSAIYDKYTF